MSKEETNNTINIDGDSVTKEELDYLTSGVRPPDMEFEKYKKLRKAINNYK